MKYGVNLMVWTTHVGPEQNALFSRIKEWGFDGVEVLLSPDEPGDVALLRRTLDGLGLERTACTVLRRDANLVSAEREVRVRGIRFLTRCVERAAELGANVICGPLHAGLGVMTGARRTKEEWQWAVDGLRSVAVGAQASGITLCVEPLNRFETYFLNTLQDASQLVHDVGASNVRIHFDTFHANIEEKQATTALRNVAKSLGHVHISENDRGIPGSGHVDWRGVLSVLHEVGYDGWMAIESFAEPEPELASAASIWRDLAPSGDELARQGLNFIKQLSKELKVA